MKIKNFLNVGDFSTDMLNKIIEMASILKAEHQKGIFRTTLNNKSFALLFEKPSTRTFVSFSVAISQLGGHTVNIHQSSLGGRESLHDIAKTLSRYVDGIVIRTFAHDSVIELAEHASVPIINALTDKYHPCQVMADYLTIREKLQNIPIKIAYIGDGFNVANSLLLLAGKTGMNIKIGSPKGFEPDSDVVEIAKKEAKNNNCTVTITNDPKEAVKDANVIYTDTWTSMGMEDEAKKRIKIFSNFQLNSDILSFADKNAIVMHCLPAHRGQEITDEVIDNKQSVVFDQAENRLWTQKAILELIYQ